MAVFGMDILVEEVTCQVQIDNSGKAKFLKI